jgi:S1-C subfamily serine protease
VGRRCVPTRIPAGTDDDGGSDHPQRGEVVNPSIETSATGAAPRQKTFLYSAIARPGNSGGPIIAQDGRVIGLVVDHTEEPQSTNLDAAEGEGSEAKDDSQTQRRAGKPPGPPFYRGVPTNQIMRALEDLDFGGLAIVEDEN